MIDRLEEIARRYHEIENEMARPEVAMDHEKVTPLAREQRTLRETVETYDAYRRARQEMERHKGGRPPLWGTPQGLAPSRTHCVVAAARPSRATREERMD